MVVEGVANSGRVETVYNIEVDEYHTYFVSGKDWQFAVWAHNASYKSSIERRRRDLKKANLQEHHVISWTHARTKTHELESKKGTGTFVIVVGAGFG